MTLQWLSDASQPGGEIDQCEERYCPDRVVAKVKQRYKSYDFFISGDRQYETCDEEANKCTMKFYLYEYSSSHTIETYVYSVEHPEYCCESPCYECVDDPPFNTKYAAKYNECIDKLDDPGSWQDFGKGFGTPSEFVGSSSIGAGTSSGGGKGDLFWSEFDKPDDLNNGATGVKACVTLTIIETGQEEKVTKELRTFHWGDKYEPPYKNVNRRRTVEFTTPIYDFCRDYGASCASATGINLAWDSDVDKSYQAKYNIQFLEYVFD